MSAPFTFSRESEGGGVFEGSARAKLDPFCRLGIMSCSMFSDLKVVVLPESEEGELVEEGLFRHDMLMRRVMMER